MNKNSLKPPLHVLFIEDSPQDVALMLGELSLGQYDVISEQVETPEALKKSLAEKTWHIILSDYRMPHFNGIQALQILKESGQDIPFVLISGQIGEETAVACLKAGAHNYLLKNHLSRLEQIVTKELQEAEERLKRREAEKQLRESEERYRLLTENLKEQTARLEDVNQELEAFSYSISHDLRAPLRRLDGFSQALLEEASDKLNDNEKGYLERIRSNSQLMAQLIDDLLNLSKLTRANIQYREVNLSQIAREILSIQQEQEHERHLDTHIEEGLIVQGDKNLLQIALQNLLLNAWKFTCNKDIANIEVGKLSLEGKEVYFVKDNGAGFNMEYVDKIFGAFQRIHRTDEFPGTGIGLAIVQRIIHRHGGKIWAEGQVNKGASIYFTLDVSPCH
jgi:light-regulated signal transduction histidine kinase (bacteriophytochrome)